MPLSLFCLAVSRYIRVAVVSTIFLANFRSILQAMGLESQLSGATNNFTHNSPDLVGDSTLS